MFAALKEHQVVPDIIDTPTAAHSVHPIEVKYPSGVEVNVGNELTPTQVKDKPNHVRLPAVSDGYMTFMMIDPDAPSRANPTLGDVIHWLVINIPSDGDVNLGETLVDYCGSGAPQGTGLHRYIFLAFKQSVKLNGDSIDVRAAQDIVMTRRNFKTREFIVKHGLGDVIGANLFQAQYDDYVPIFRTQFKDYVLPTIQK